MKAIMITVRLWWFYLTYKGIKKAEIRKRFAKDFKGKIFECVSKTNWKKDLMKIPEEEREFFKQFVGKVGLCFECDKVEEIAYQQLSNGVGYDCIFYTDTIGNIEEKSCLETSDLINYLGISIKDGGIVGKAIHITKLEIFDKPKDISEFKQMRADSCGIYYKSLTRAPQSWCYIEVDL